MGLFSRRSKRGGKGEGEFQTQRWRGLASSVSKTCEMSVERFNAAVASERASAAAHAAAGDTVRARAAAELALRNRAMVKALARLASIADALHARDLPITSISSLRELHEPIRTEVVSFVYAAGRLSVQPLSEAVEMLKSHFPDDVEDITRARYEWPDILDSRLYEALAPGPANSQLVEKELQAAYADYPEYSGSGTGTGTSSIHQPPPPPTSASPPRPTRSPPPPVPSATVPSPPPRQSPRSNTYSPRPPSPRPALARMSPPPPMPAFTSDPGPAQVPRPWERNTVPSGIPVTTASNAYGAIHPPPPAPQPLGRTPKPVSTAPQPDYMQAFQDSDEAVAQRYRDLLAG